MRRTEIRNRLLILGIYNDLVNFIEIIWWRKTKNINLVKKLENLKNYLIKNIQPRLAWEITFLKIAMEEI